MEYYLAMKRNKLLVYTIAWINLPRIMLSEKAKSPKLQTILLHLYNISKEWILNEGQSSSSQGLGIRIGWWWWQEQDWYSFKGNMRGLQSTASTQYFDCADRYTSEKTVWNFIYVYMCIYTYIYPNIYEWVQVKLRKNE